VICEIMKDDGTMARMDDLMSFAQLHGLKIGTIRDLIAYRRRYDHLVQQVNETRIVSTHGGEWTAKTYINKAEYAEHLVLQKGKVEAGKPTLVRMHGLSIFTDMLGEGERAGQLQRAMEIIGDEGAGIVVIIRDNSPDRLTKLIANRAQGLPADMEQRDYGIGAQILVDLGVHEMVLLTNSHRTFVGLDGYGLEVVGEKPIPTDR
jgi:3,4-dihydroxy 2-butanone 4-phosphate synthase / GTP cyclohydrolase II